MTKNILVIGGSYFIGRVFVQNLSKAEGYTLHVLNRGRFPSNIPGVIEYKCDRRDPEGVRILPSVKFDCVVDFCAYHPDDAAIFLHNFAGEIGQYIYISSCSVFEPSQDYPKEERFPKLKTQPPGPVGEYAYNKWLLEQEFSSITASKNIPLTILRPTFVYGPYNYAPRESFYFKQILAGEPISMPKGNLALFQFVYVQDIYSIIEKCIGNKEVYYTDFNLSAPEMISYNKLEEIFEEITGRDLPVQKYSLDEIYENDIPLPFPLEQHELYSGDKIARLLSFEYTPFYQGMKTTFDFYAKYYWK